MIWLVKPSKDRIFRTMESKNDVFALWARNCDCYCPPGSMKGADVGCPSLCINLGCCDQGFVLPCPQNCHSVCSGYC
jgi:hypothetical protein